MASGQGPYTQIVKEDNIIDSVCNLYGGVVWDSPFCEI